MCTSRDAEKTPEMFSARRKSSINRALKEKQESRTSNGATAAPEGGFAPSISQLMLTERSKSKPMSGLVGELSTDGAAAPSAAQLVGSAILVRRWSFGDSTCTCTCTCTGLHASQQESC